jgi:hypothetical protein
VEVSLLSSVSWSTPSGREIGGGFSTLLHKIFYL